MSHAILPEGLEEHSLDSMQTGEIAYTLPWGMWVDAERRCWLHPKYPAETSPHGTVRMRVELHGNGYHVWPPSGESWQPQHEPGYVSPRDTVYLPVAELHMAKVIEQQGENDDWEWCLGEAEAIFKDAYTVREMAANAEQHYRRDDACRHTCRHERVECPQYYHPGRNA
jgi:hypothetical protein